MKRFLLLAILFFQFLFVASDADAFYMDWQVRGGSYFPIEGKLQKIYSDGWPCGAVETSFHFAYPWDEIHWKFWINATYFNKKGHSIGLHKRTTYQLCPVSAGLSYTWYCGDWEAYLGFGPNVAHVHFKDNSCFVHRHVNKTNFGFTGKSGLRYWIGQGFFCDVFADYIFSKFKFHGHKHFIFRHGVDASGPFVGIGLGYAF